MTHTPHLKKNTIQKKLQTDCNPHIPPQKKARFQKNYVLFLSSFCKSDRSNESNGLFVVLSFISIS